MFRQRLGFTIAIPTVMTRADMQRPITYRDRESRVWYASEVARLKVVSAAIDGPNLCLVIRFEREGEERFARWIGGDNWLERGALHRLFAEAEPAEEMRVASQPVATSAAPNDTDTGVREASPESLAAWLKLVATMGPDDLAALEERTFTEWDRALLVELRGAIRHRWRQLTGD